MIIIKTTVTNIDVKKNIIDELILNKFSSCINIIENATAHYIWKNQLVEDREDIMLIKTTIKNEKKIYKIIKKLHNFDVPEIITINVANIDKSYFNWLNQTISSNNS